MFIVGFVFLYEFTMHWKIAANFFDEPHGRWLDDFIRDDRLTFEKVPSPGRYDWHRGGRKTPVFLWYQNLVQACAATRNAPGGIVTCFPQLAFCVALLKRLGFTNARIVAHNFNLGDISAPLKGRCVGAILGAVDVFLVHSPAEIDAYANWLRLPRERFRFVPLQRGEPPGDEPTSDDAFVLAMGSAHRDYATLLEALAATGLPARIVCKRSLVADLEVPPNVEILSDLSEEECRRLLRRARMLVTPVANASSASGQVTFVEGMRLAKPVLVTRCPGSQGYVRHLETGILLEPGDAEGMAAWMRHAWSDAGLRQRLSRAARAFYERELSDEVAARRLHQILWEVGMSGAARSVRRDRSWRMLWKGGS